MKSDLKTSLLAIMFLLIGIPAISVKAQHFDHHKQEPPVADRWTYRYSWQLPNRVLKEIGVKEGMTIADIGAGDGYFTFYLAKSVGESGKIYASDIDNNSLQNLRNRMNKENVKNISVILGKPEDPLIPENSTDIALIVNVLPAIRNPKPFFSNIAKCLKPDGKLVIIQWAAEKMDRDEINWDSPIEYALRTYLRQIYNGDFEVVQLLTFLPLQNIFVCKPKVR